MSIKYCISCKCYLCDHHILINEDDEHIFDYHFKLCEKMYIFRRLLKNRNFLSFYWEKNLCKNHHSITFSKDELQEVCRNKSLLKLLNIFHHYKVFDPCRISFYTHVHCNLISKIMTSFNLEFGRYLYLIRYKNQNSTYSKEYKSIRQSSDMGVALYHRSIFNISNKFSENEEIYSFKNFPLENGRCSYK